MAWIEVGGGTDDARLSGLPTVKKREGTRHGAVVTYREETSASDPCLRRCVAGPSGVMAKMLFGKGRGKEKLGEGWLGSRPPASIGSLSGGNVRLSG